VNPPPTWGFEWVRSAYRRGGGTLTVLVASAISLGIGVWGHAPALIILGVIGLLLVASWSLHTIRATRTARRIEERDRG